MPPINILIKPASSACNMACRYCFYRDVAENREHAFEGMLTLETMEKVIIEGFAYAEHLCSFMFHSGEPTLRGLDFFRQVVALAHKHNTKNLRLQFGLQTNGYAIDEEWAAFFHENHFLIGLSLDGPAEIHNFNRVDTAGKGTFNQILRTARLFDRYQVEYNILCVVTGQNARFVEKIYRFYRKNGFRWPQFIPCLEPLGEERGGAAYHLSAKGYGDFLIRLFDLWFQDLKNGEYISVRHLDNWLSILLGERPEACNMTGHCAVQFVIEGDGGVYPCDFYVLDEWRLGTVGEQSFAEMQCGETARRFVEKSLQVPEKCRTCRYRMLCRNGCRRDRVESAAHPEGLSRYCEAHERFFDARLEQMQEALRIIRRMRGE